MLIKDAFSHVLSKIELSVGKSEESTTIREILSEAPDMQFSVELAKHCMPKTKVSESNEIELNSFLDLIAEVICETAVEHAATCTECAPSDYSGRTLIYVILHYAYHLEGFDQLPGILIIIGQTNPSRKEGEESKCSDPKPSLRDRLKHMNPTDFGKC